MKKESRQMRSIKRAVRAGERELQRKHPHVQLTTKVVSAADVINNATAKAQAKASNQKENS